MTPKPSFMTPLDYTFYLRKLVEREKQTNFDYDLSIKENSLTTIGLAIETPKLSELIHKLAEDLKSSSGNFVDTFVDEPHNGLSWLLDLLRSTLNRQQCPGMAALGYQEPIAKNHCTKNRDRHLQLKRAMIDEYDCLLCIKNATNRKPKSLSKILNHRNGLTTLASCIVSNLTKSRLIALEILTKVCNLEPNGSRKVLEALSTMRIIFGESVRFKLLISIINSTCSLTATNCLELTVITFLNTLLRKSVNQAERVRLQCEMEEAGLDVNNLEMKMKDKGLPAGDPLWLEIKQWRDNYIDVVETLRSKNALFKEVSKLHDENESLQKSITKLESEKIKMIKIEKELKEKCDSLEAELIIIKARLSEYGIKYSSKKANGRPGSDNSDPVSATGDSGQWSESEGGEANRHAEIRSAKSTSKYEAVCESDDQSMRNEDIFIYIPSIRPPASFSALVKNSLLNESEDWDEVKNETKAKKLHNENTSKHLSNSDSRWRFKHQSSVDSELTVVEAYSKASKTELPEKNHSSSTIGQDYENIKIASDPLWFYPDLNSRLNETHNNKKPLSHSIGQLNTLLAENDHDKEFKSSESSKQFFFKSRGSSVSSLTEPVKVTRLENFFTSCDPSPVSFHSQRPPASSSKSKNFAVSLQSYFFGGSQKSKHRRSEEIFNDGCDSTRSFPLPTGCKKNFILTGHGNCGLYSGDELENSFRKEELSENMSKLVHREIALAAKELGAWF